MRGLSCQGICALIVRKKSSVDSGPRSLKRQRTPDVPDTSSNAAAIIASSGAKFLKANVDFAKLSELILQLNKQLSFVQHAMAPDVACSTGFGREAVMRSWRWLQFFGDVQVELQALKKSIGGVINAITKTSVTITKDTFWNLFPHLNNPAVGGTEHGLASNLVG
ncbi:unnamed protein product [Phytophthora lilii]|uniref:Unnamed protein product n=1 Tax=Phytophthora lilii TaxID=2077276 RepID=A0A9W6TB48_9STRA|nr:unnamed protein product [Phytophthora lilii]